MLVTSLNYFHTRTIYGQQAIVGDFVAPFVLLVRKMYAKVLPAKTFKVHIGVSQKRHCVAEEFVDTLQ